MASSVEQEARMGPTAHRACISGVCHPRVDQRVGRVDAFDAMGGRDGENDDDDREGGGDGRG